MILETEIPAFAFSNYFREVIVSSSQNVDFTLSYKKNGTDDYVIILEETYTPDTNNKVILFDLQRIINSSLESDIHGYFRFIFSSGTENITSDSHILLSRVEINIPASDFTRDNFLSILKGDKITRTANNEYLSLYVSAVTEIKVVARYRESDGSYSQNATDMPPVTNLNTITTVDVSPRNFVQNNKELVLYAVIAGNRIQKFYVDGFSRESPLHVAFINSFGVLETFCLWGNLDYENKYSNEYGYVRNQYEMLSAAMVREYTAHTGILKQNIAEWIEELYMSKDILIIKDMALSKRLTIVDSTVKRSSIQSEIPVHEFKYRLSQRQQYVIDFAARMQRIFDITFDYTFN